MKKSFKAITAILLSGLLLLSGCSKHSDADYEALQAELEAAQAELSSVQTELEQTKTSYEMTNAELEQSKATVEQLNTDMKKYKTVADAAVVVGRALTLLHGTTLESLVASDSFMHTAKEGLKAMEESVSLASDDYSVDTGLAAVAYAYAYSYED